MGPQPTSTKGKGIGEAGDEALLAQLVEALGVAAKPAQTATSLLYLAESSSRLLAVPALAETLRSAVLPQLLAHIPSTLPPLVRQVERASPLDADDAGLFGEELELRLTAALLRALAGMMVADTACAEIAARAEAVQRAYALAASVLPRLLANAEHEDEEGGQGGAPAAAAAAEGVKDDSHAPRAVSAGGSISSHWPLHWAAAEAALLLVAAGTESPGHFWEAGLYGTAGLPVSRLPEPSAAFALSEQSAVPLLLLCCSPGLLAFRPGLVTSALAALAPHTSTIAGRAAVRLAAFEPMLLALASAADAPTAAKALLCASRCCLASDCRPILIECGLVSKLAAALSAAEPTEATVKDLVAADLARAAALHPAPDPVEAVEAPAKEGAKGKEGGKGGKGEAALEVPGKGTAGTKSRSVLAKPNKGEEKEDEDALALRAASLCRATIVVRQAHAEAAAAGAFGAAALLSRADAGAKACIGSGAIGGLVSTLARCSQRTLEGQARDARLKLGALPPVPGAKAGKEPPKSKDKDAAAAAAAAAAESPLSALLLPTATYASLAAACALALANALHVPNTLEALAVDKTGKPNDARLRALLSPLAALCTANPPTPPEAAEYAFALAEWETAAAAAAASAAANVPSPKGQTKETAAAAAAAATATATAAVGPPRPASASADPVVSFLWRRAATHAAVALGHAATHTAARSLLIDSQAASLLLSLALYPADSQFDVVRAAALHALANLCRSEEAREELRGKGACSALVELLEASLVPEIKVAIARVAQQKEMAKEKDARARELAEEGGKKGEKKGDKGDTLSAAAATQNGAAGLPGSPSPSDSPEVQVGAALCLAALLVDDASRQMLRPPEGPFEISRNKEPGSANPESGNSGADSGGGTGQSGTGSTEPASFPAAAASTSGPAAVIVRLSLAFTSLPNSPDSDPRALRALASAVQGASRDWQCAQLMCDNGVFMRLVNLSRPEAGHPAAAVAADACRTLLTNCPPAMYWWAHNLPDSTITIDGFYDLGQRHEWRALPQLRSAGPSLVPLDSAVKPRTPEALLADTRLDPTLKMYIRQVREAVGEDSGRKSGKEATKFTRLRYLQEFVVSQLGGRMPYAAYEHFSCDKEVASAVAESRSDIVLIGQLRKGRARHRAFLFKVLADRVGEPCSLIQSDYSRGAHSHHAWVTVRQEGVSKVVDLLHEEGMLYTEGSVEAERYTRQGDFRHSSLASMASVWTIDKPSALAA